MENRMLYHFTVTEKIINFLLKWGIIKCSAPSIECRDSEDDYIEFDVAIGGKSNKFYVKKDGLQVYELRATYRETFCDWRINGHAYVRKETPVNEGDIVVDGGGCEGFFTRYALDRGADKVIVFEPCNKLADGLCKTFSQEILQGRVIVVRKALSSKKEEQSLVINEDMYCSSNVGYLDVPKNKKEEIIGADRLDNLIEELGIEKIDLIKMDIEGAEMDALMGAQKIIRNYKPKMMIATYHAYANSMECKNIVKGICADYVSKFCGYYTYEKPYRPYLTLFY